MSIGCFVVLWIFAPQLTQAFLGLEDLALNAYTVDAFRRYGISYLLLGFNVFIGGYLTARERPRGAIAISTGRGLIVQAAALLTLAATLGGDAIWFTPVISEGLILLLSVVLLRRFVRK